jgi:hypothetical protein
MHIPAFGKTDPKIHLREQNLLLMGSNGCQLSPPKTGAAFEGV